MKTFSLAAIVLAVAPLLMSSVAYGGDSKDHAYLSDRNGRPVEVRSGGCLRSRYWTPDRADAHCKATWDKTSLQALQSK